MILPDFPLYPHSVILLHSSTFTTAIKVDVFSESSVHKLGLHLNVEGVWRIVSVSPPGAAVQHKWLQTLHFNQYNLSEWYSEIDGSIVPCKSDL